MFRQYKQGDKIYDTYKEMREKQSVEHYDKMVDKYCKLRNKTYTIWEALEATNNFIDLSDPDMDLPNMYHMYQTAEALRKDDAPDWMIICGLIHDLGKIMYLWGCDEDGTSLKHQWSMVGDTYVLGYPLPSSAVYLELAPRLACDQYSIYDDVLPWLKPWVSRSLRGTNPH